MNLLDDDLVLWIYYPGDCLSISIIMVVNLLWPVTFLKVRFALYPCGAVKIIEQCEENYSNFNQNQKDDLAPTCTCIVFYD